MTTEDLKNRVVAEFKELGLGAQLDLAESDFRELPTFFEVSHFSMGLAVTEDVIDVATSIATDLRSSLQKQGIELDYVVRATQHV